MEVEGRIIEVLAVQKSAEGAAKAWTKVDFIVETEGQYPKKVCINSFNGKIPESQLVVGNKVKVSVNIESKEFNGKWYTTVNAWKMEVLEAAQQQSYAPPSQQAPFAAGEDNTASDLPF